MFRVFMMTVTISVLSLNMEQIRAYFSSELSGGHFYFGVTIPISYKRFYVKLLNNPNPA